MKMSTKIKSTCLCIMIACTVIGCAPTPGMKVVSDNKVDSAALDESILWMNDSIGCEFFQRADASAGDWFGLFPSRGTVTVEVNPKKVHSRIHPDWVGKTRESVRCGSRARIFLDNFSKDKRQVIVHELGHAACLDHIPGTFMSESLPTQKWVIAPNQIDKLQKQCDALIDAREEEEEEAEASD